MNVLTSQHLLLRPTIFKSKSTASALVLFVTGSLLLQVVQSLPDVDLGHICEPIQDVVLKEREDSAHCFHLALQVLQLDAVEFVGTVLISHQDSHSNSDHCVEF